MIILFESSEAYFTEFTYQWEILNSYANFQSSKITHYSCCLIWILHKGAVSLLSSRLSPCGRLKTDSNHPYAASKLQEIRPRGCEIARYITWSSV